MKLLTIYRNRLEIARAQLRKPLIVIGRSPTCDVVLRAPGIKPVHFIVEWIGGGVFDPNKGSWSIADVSAGAEAGEGLVLTRDPVTVAEFSFKAEESNLESSDRIGGKIVSNLSERDPSRKSEVLEMVQVRSDSGAIEDVMHYALPLKKNKVVVRSFQIEMPKIKTEGLINIILQEMPGAELYLSGRKIAQTHQIELKEHDLLQVKWRGHDFYLRFVDQVDAPPIPQDFWGDPLLKRLTLGISALAILLLILVQLTPEPEPEPIEPQRIARVEIAAPPPPPEVETKTVSEEVVETQAPVQSKAESEPAKAAAPSVVKQPTKPPKAGLNNNSKPANVNQVGVLGALSNLQKSGKGVSANQILNQGVIHETATGQNDAKIVINNPPSGVIGSGSGGAPTGKSSNQLAAASSTLSGVTKAAPNSVGPFARKDGSTGYTLGTGTTGREGTGGTGIGELDSGEFSISGGGLDRETVRRIIKSYQGRIRTCYDRALISQPKLQGRIVYTWRIEPSGSVTGSKIFSSTVESPSLRGCVLEVVQSMVFPKAPNGKPTVVKYPFVFQGSK